MRTQIRKKRYSAQLRDSVQMSIEMAITDALTGLHNRRYMESHLSTLAEQAAARGKPMTLLIIGIDCFKAINDTFDHDAGDDVLRGFAIRLRKSTRGIDLARYGGEEFVVVMPETDRAVASVVAERIRRHIASEPFAIRAGKARGDVTISIGLASERIGGHGSQARRSGPLPGETARPQPGRRRCRLNATQGEQARNKRHAVGRTVAAPASTITLYVDDESSHLIHRIDVDFRAGSISLSSERLNAFGIGARGGRSRERIGRSS